MYSEPPALYPVHSWIYIERELRKIKSGVELYIHVQQNDVVLISSSAAGLRKHLHTLSEFCQKWTLVVNTKKTKVYVFRKDTVYSWNNTILEKTQSYKYLGVWFTRNGKFTKAKKHLADQAKKALLSTIARLHHPPIPIILQLYESTLKPIMFYGCEIWGFTENTDLEKVELQFLKVILHLPTLAPNMAVRGELGQLPIHMWWKERILKFWDWIYSEEVPKLLKAAIYRSLELLKLEENVGHRMWLTMRATLNSFRGALAVTNEKCNNVFVQRPIYSTMACNIGKGA